MRKCSKFDDKMNTLVFVNFLLIKIFQTLTDLSKFSTVNILRCTVVQITNCDTCASTSVNFTKWKTLVVENFGEWAKQQIGDKNFDK